MKQMKLLILLMLVLSLVITSFASCELADKLGITLPGKDNDGETNDNGTDNETPGETPNDGEKPDDGENNENLTKEQIWAKDYDCHKISELAELCPKSGQSTVQRYYVIGTVTAITDETFGTMTVEDESGTVTIAVSYNHDGSARYDLMSDKPAQGDLILVYGTLRNVDGTVEIKSGRIIDFYNPNGTEEPKEEIKPGDTITIAQAKELAKTANENDRYYILATVESITKPQYGAMTISDETGSIDVYNSKNEDGTVGYADMEDKPYKGDTVRLFCTLHLFNDTPEIASAYIVEFEHAELEIDLSLYMDVSISEARTKEDGTLVKVDGVVARITYATGFVPSGFFLIDDTDAIYVYDGNLAARVSVGNRVTIAGEKTHWILESEQNNAAKFGYKGCNQIATAYLVDNDGKVNEFDKSWIDEVTVKDILDTPVTDDITTTIYKVTALVKKVPGNGFTNYYFFDLDENTSTYTYSQCNGGDFAWLDAFDGKICTVYISALNAKSTAADCYFRFVPIEVIDEGFVFDVAGAPEFAVKYHALGQFLTYYTGDPELEVITSVSSALLGFENVEISYTTSDDSIIAFTETEGKLVMHCLDYGTVKITVTATYNGNEYSEEITIVHLEPVNYEFISVEEAVGAEVGETVTVKGIVGPSLVNKVGFYLMGDDAMIAVLTTSDIMTTVELGHEVILQGTKHVNTKGGTTYFGQTCIKDAVILTNYLGAHEYNDDAFITDKTLADLYNLNPLEDHTTEVYVVKAVVNYVETDYYTSLNLSHDGTTFNLYMSGAGQYSWLKDFAGQEVTLEIAPCNWNDKDYYRGCVLSVILEDGTKVYNTLNFDVE